MDTFTPKFTATVRHLRAEIDRRGNARIVRVKDGAPGEDGAKGRPRGSEPFRGGKGPLGGSVGRASPGTGPR